MLLKIRPEDLRDPLASEEPLVRIENAFDCDGVECGTVVADEDGKPMSSVRHDVHLVLSGREPLASPRRMAISA
jgi:hypothetical protein